MSSDNRIIVTGCSGFVGRNTVRMLLSEGYDVIGFSRTNPRIEGLQFIPFDITDPRNFQTDEYRYTTIINAAAITSNSKHGNFADTNYRAVLRLLSLNPHGKFLQISSSSIYDLGKNSENVTEDAFALGKYKFYNPYSAYKAKAEEALIRGEVERNIHPISLRPHAIYGLDDTTLMPALRERIKFGSIILPDKGEVQHALTGIHNLLDAIKCGLTYEGDRPEAFNVTDADPVTISFAVREALGENLRVVGVPTRVLLGRIGRLAKVSEYEIRQLGMNRTYDLTKARQLLGYKPTAFQIK